MLTDLIELGRRMNIARREAEMSLTDVAAEAGVATSTIQRYEKGKIARVKLPVIESIAGALHVDPDWLLQKTDEPYDYELDPDNRLVCIPSALFREWMSEYNDPKKVYQLWMSLEKSTAEDAAREAYVHHLRQECEKMNLVISDTDPQIDRILAHTRKLNAQGLAKLGDYAEDLSDSPKYQKQNPSNEG